jgi:hypothetical protein
MAKQAKQAAPAQGDNSVEQRWVREIEKHHGTLDSLKGSYMNECKQVREMIADCYARAKDAGLPKRALKAVIKTRELQRKIDDMRADLCEDGLDEDYDRIRERLGDLADTPLGANALKNAPQPSPLAGALGDGEFDAVGADNAARIEAGIKPLPN